MTESQPPDDPAAPPVRALDPQHVARIRARAHQVLASGPPPPIVGLEAATASVFSALMLLWAASAVAPAPH